jgi:hypothetical protein
MKSPDVPGCAGRLREHLRRHVIDGRERHSA